MLVIIGASGKLGFATLNALLNHNLIPAEQIICTTSSESGAQKLEPTRQKGVQIRTAHWDDQASFEAAIPKDCDKLFLISSSRIQKDYGDIHPPSGKGREEDHFKVLQAARNQNVKHVYYTSLAFANPSKSRVMTAHERTEEWLKKETKYTILREGLYNESWPLYLGHWKVPDDNEGREKVRVAGDGKISWTSIADLGLASALILAAPSEEWAEKVVYLSQEKAYTLQEVAEMVGKARGKSVELNVVPREEHEKYYIEERGMSSGHIIWWAKTFDAVSDGECEIHDPTLEKLLESKGVKLKSMEETVKAMLQK